MMMRNLGVVPVGAETTHWPVPSWFHGLGLLIPAMRFKLIRLTLTLVGLDERRISSSIEGTDYNRLIILLSAQRRGGAGSGKLTMTESPRYRRQVVYLH